MRGRYRGRPTDGVSGWRHLLADAETAPTAPSKIAKKTRFYPEVSRSEEVASCASVHSPVPGRPTDGATMRCCCALGLDKAEPIGPSPNFLRAEGTFSPNQAEMRNLCARIFLVDIGKDFLSFIGKHTGLELVGNLRPTLPPNFEKLGLGYLTFQCQNREPTSC